MLMAESSFKLTETQSLNYQQLAGVFETPAVFVHGNLASSVWWKPCLENLQGGKRSSAYLLDLLGHGKSSDPSNPLEMRPDHLAKNLNAFVESLGVGPVNVVGHSAGGLISAIALSENPKLYKGAYLISPVGSEGVQFGIGVLESFKRAREDSSWRYQVMSAAVHKEWLQREELIEQMSSDFLRSSKKAGFWMIEQSTGCSFKSLLKNTGLAGRVLSGQHDLIIPPKDSATLSQTLGFEFELLPGFAHCPNTEDPNYFQKLMMAYFLSQDVFAQTSGS